MILRNFIPPIVAYFIIFFVCEICDAQCDYIPSTSLAVDTLTYNFSGGTFASFGCAPIDPTYWLSGSGDSITATFVDPQSYPSFRVWGMNDDDSASVSVNGFSYPLTATSASYDAKVVCGISPGPDGIVFSGGNLVGANSNVMGNYSFQNVTIHAANVSSITIAGLSGAGWGFAGVSVNCYPLSINTFESETLNVFPNPASATIFLQGKLFKNAEVTFINEWGMCLKKIKSFDDTIDISDFPQGVYSVSIRVNNQTITKRIVKI